MPRHILSAVFVLFIIIGLKAQMTYHRGYPIQQLNSGNDPDTSLFNLGGLQLKDKNYLSFDGLLPTDDSTFHYFLITSLDNKGDLNWSRRIGFNDATVRINPGTCSIFQASNDSIYFSFSLFNGDHLKCIGSIDKEGKTLWIKVLTQAEVQILGTNTNLLAEGKDSILYNFTNYEKANVAELIATSLNARGDLILSQKYTYLDNDGFEVLPGVYGIHVAEDSTIAITGNISTASTFPEIFLSVADKSLQFELSKRYAAPDAVNFPLLSGFRVLKTGSDYLVSGQFWDLNPFDLFGSYLGSFVMKTDRNGKVIWSKVIDPNLSFINAINGLEVGSDNNIYVSGSILNVDGNFVPFMVSMKQNGEQNWFNTYDRAIANFAILGNLFKTDDKGLGYFYSDVENEDGLLKTGFIKTDLKGVTTCETVNTEILFTDVNISEDTLVVEADTIDAQLENVSAVMTEFDKFDIPVLPRELVQVCSNLPIDYTFHADVTGGVKWKWSDESTADSLRVMAVGQYSVTVTVDDKYCFELCDTNEVKPFAVPTVQASRGGTVCEGADFTLTASPTFEKPPISFLWNTQENTQSITKNQLGTYIVTVTDGCGITATSSVVVDQSIWFGPPVVTIANNNLVCENSDFTLVATGTSPAGGDILYSWSTGETITTIVNDELGIYRVTVTDRCNKTATASVMVNSDIYYKAAPGLVLSQDVPNYCETQQISLLAVASTSFDFDLKEFKWSNGQTSTTNPASIVVTTLGEYKVTITDECGNTNEAAINVVDPTSIVDSCIKFPKLFFARTTSTNPDTTNQMLYANNGLFGPFSSCLKNDSIDIQELNINDFEFRVYNRWGKEVFSSDDPIVRWNGRKDGDGEFFPADTYVWYATYKIGQFCESKRKGDVTFLR